VIIRHPRRLATRAAAVLVATIAATAAPARAQVREVTLDEAVRLALQANPAVIQARGQLSIASAGKREAIGNWLPTISSNSGWSRSSSSRFDERTQTIITGASSSYNAGLSASLTLFDGFQRFAEHRSANATFESADAGLVNQEFQISLQTKQAYFNALAANELVRAAERSIQRAEEQLRVSRDKLAAGSAIRSDTLRGRVELANAQLQRLNAETQRATAEATLARLMGLDGAVRPIFDSTLLAPVALDTARLRSEARAQSPAIIQADAAERVADANVSMSRSAYLPTVNGSYSRSWAGQTLDNMTGSWSMRMSLSWPLFNGFTRESNLSRSLANRETARAQAEDARRQVNEQLTGYLASLVAAQTSLEIATASRAAAEEELRVQQERYRLGVATIIEVLASQVSLDQAEVDIVRAQFDYLVAKAQIEALVGQAL
jgi:outer membrane protein TolC